MAGNRRTSSLAIAPDHKLVSASTACREPFRPNGGLSPKRRPGRSEVALWLHRIETATKSEARSTSHRSWTSALCCSSSSCSSHRSSRRVSTWNCPKSPGRTQNQRIPTNSRSPSPWATLPASRWERILRPFPRRNSKGESGSSPRPNRIRKSWCGRIAVELWRSQVRSGDPARSAIPKCRVNRPTEGGKHARLRPDTGRTSFVFAGCDT